MGAFNSDDGEVWRAQRRGDGWGSSLDGSTTQMNFPLANRKHEQYQRHVCYATITSSPAPVFLTITRKSTAKPTRILTERLDAERGGPSKPWALNCTALELLPRRPVMDGTHQQADVHRSRTPQHCMNTYSNNCISISGGVLVTKVTQTNLTVEIAFDRLFWQRHLQRSPKVGWWLFLSPVQERFGHANW